VTTVRVAAHVHSDWSYDGSWTLPAIARAFGRLGYDAVLTAEHDLGFHDERWTDYRVACARASTDDVLLVPGIEYQDSENVVHIPVWGSDIPFLGEARPTIETLTAAREHDAVTLFAHPARRRAAERYRPEWTPLLTAVEIWSRKYDGIAPRLEAQALARREGLAEFVSLDFHTRRQFFPLAMAVTIDGPVSSAPLLAALKAGAGRPQLFGVPAVHFVDGAAARPVRSLETARRRLRAPVHRRRAARV
jgi:predicted metal-dependent phosphoesterase TrpH